MNPHSRLGATFVRSHPAAAARVLEGFPAESAAQYLAGAVSNGLGTMTAIGELFTATAGYLLATLITTGTSLTHRPPP